MKKESLMFAVSGLIIGFLIGFMVGGKTMSGGSVQQAAAPQGVTSAAGMGSLQSRIAELEKIVASDPKNVQAWVTLGNDYFDSQNPKKAIEAYSKALALNPDDPNVLTDQGVMFRAMGFYDKALANFEKAYKIKPDHLQSLFNMGIIYSQDLKQPVKAKALFEAVAQKGGNSDIGDQAREILKQIPAEK